MKRRNSALKLKNRTVKFLAVAASAALVTNIHAQFLSHGLVGVGRIPADSFDALGPGIDSLAGLFSSMTFDPATLQVATDVNGNPVYAGVIYAQPDRGYSNGTTDYHPRIEILQF